MSRPSTILGTSFNNFCGDFNNAVNIGNYSKILPYLLPTVTMVRVDDFDSITGTKAYIVKYLHQTQTLTNNWPTFTPITSVVDTTHGTVTGQGTYIDNADTGVSINVSFSFRFRQDASTGYWLIGYASATPTPDNA
jgi:hypothetical protein